MCVGRAEYERLRKSGFFKRQRQRLQEAFGHMILCAIYQKPGEMCDEPNCMTILCFDHMTAHRKQHYLDQLTEDEDED